MAVEYAGGTEREQAKRTQKMNTLPLQIPERGKVLGSVQGEQGCVCSSADG